MCSVFGWSIVVQINPDNVKYKVFASFYCIISSIGEYLDEQSLLGNYFTFTYYSSLNIPQIITYYLPLVLAYTDLFKRILNSKLL